MQKMKTLSVWTTLVTLAVQYLIQFMPSWLRNRIKNLSSFICFWLSFKKSRWQKSCCHYQRGRLQCCSLSTLLCGCQSWTAPAPPAYAVLTAFTFGVYNLSCIWPVLTVFGIFLYLEWLHPVISSAEIDQAWCM